MTPEETTAWELYCKTTAGCMSARDFWHELSAEEQQRYLARVRHARVDEIRSLHQ